MPRKYTDGQLVRVEYSTRHTYRKFLGMVESFKDSKYYVRCLSSSPRFSNDVVFECRTKELRQPTSYEVDDFEKELMDSYQSVMKRSSELRNLRMGNCNKDYVLWTSFAVKRFEDMAWHRKFPITTQHGRSDYVY